MKVAINGFGRIGKLVLRAFLEKNIKGIDLVAINELGSLESSLHLMKYDSIHGKLPVEISKTKDGIKWVKSTLKKPKRDIERYYNIIELVREDLMKNFNDIQCEVLCD